jgi:hypothetical protein
MEKIAHSRVVAVAVHHCPLEMPFVVFEFLFDIRKLGVELVLF